MKKYIWHFARAVGLCVFLYSSIYAQNINRLEYYIDTDPGFGNGTAVSFSAASTINETFTIPMTTVGDGFHFLGVRAKDDVNKWSTVIMRPFYKERISGTTSPFGVITAMEYFIDTDPGFGYGTAVTFTAATTTNDFTFVAPLTSVSDGLHWLSVRAKDSGNKWSTVVVRPFFKDVIPIAATIPNITNIEYFIDTDPGFGNGTAVSITPNTTLTNLAITANLAGVSYGFHRLFIRVKDANNKWSTVGTKDFNVCLLPVNATITASGATTLCSGQNVVLSVPTGNSYQWYRDGSILTGSTAATYSATSSGSYSVVVSSAGCSSTSPAVEVKVNSNSAPSIATSTPTICNGSQAILSTSNCDGLVTWSNGSTGNPLVFSPKVTATYTATCTRTGCASPSSPSSAVTITVNNTPAAMTVSGAPASPVCPGTSVTLTTGSCSGVRTWSQGTTGGSITVAPLETTTYTVTCTSGTCTSKGSATVTIVSPSPTAMTINTPNQAVCAGTTITLNASNCPGGSILWSNGAAGNNITVTPTITTTYTATCTIGSCTNTGQNGVQIVVINPPNPPTVNTVSQTICRGSEVVLFASNCGNEIIWSNGSVGNNITVIPQVTTTYTAVCKFDGCPSTSSNAATITVSDCADPSVNITRIEYFIDNDPGFGNGTAVTSGFSAAPAINDFTFTAPITAVTNGLHWLSVRAKDANNKWSTVSVNVFLKDVIPSSVMPPNLTKVEYFFDLDPGFGLGTDVPITAGTTLNDLVFSATIPNAMTLGIHNMSVRVKDANNKWSTVAVRTFLKQAIPPVAGIFPNIVAMEYFINIDPGFGLGTAIPVTPLAPMKNIIASVTLEDLNLGINRLFIRAKDANNVWSTVGVNEFSIQDNIVQMGTTPSVACKTVAFSVPYSLVGTFNAGNVFTAQLSNSSGSFSSPLTIGTLTSTAAGTISATIPNSVTAGSGFLIRVISSNPAVTNSYSKPITINDIPPTPLIQSSDADNIVCTGSSVTLAVTNCSGAILWSNAATSQSIVVTNSGNYSATCTTNSCASTTSQIQNVVVTPLPPTPTVTSNDADNIICTGGNITLTAGNCAGSFLWSTLATTASITVTTAGSYTVKCKVNGCESNASIAQVIVVNPIPSTPSITSNDADNLICTTGSAVLTISSCSGTIAWSTGATTASITVTSAGSYSAICTVNGCPSLSSNIIGITVNGVCPPCPQTLTLQSTADDFTTGVVIKETNATTGTITAINKITGTANVIYRAGKSISLEPGFVAENGTVFKTEFGGCN